MQELDGGSVNNTLHAGQPGTAALARAVLAPGGLASPMTSPAGSAHSTPRAERGPADGSPLTQQSDRDSNRSLPVTSPPEFIQKRDGSKRGEVYV